jgi:hypothetical protein
VEDIIAVQGWGVEIWHGFTTDSNEHNSAQAVNETVFRTHLAELASDYEQSIWVAPQGKVARYYLEQQESTIENLLVTDSVIILRLAFGGDKTIFNEPLTFITIIPEHWLSERLIVMQDGTPIDYAVDAYTIEPIGGIIVSGDISPDATGSYYKLPSQYNGQPAYKAQGKNYYIWSTGSQYFLSDGLGNEGYNCWFSGDGTSPIGTYYVEDANATGTPIAIAVPNNEPCLLYDVLPGGGVINIVSVPMAGDINADGDADLVDFASRFGSHQLE